jgi:purine-binding chemotaxis protein CheW
MPRACGGTPVTTSLLSFELAGERFAIDFASVRAVVEAAAPCRLPETPDFLLGIVPSPVGSVPLVDLSRKFRLSESKPAGPTTAVVVETRVDGVAALLGIAVGDSCQVVDVASEEIEPPPPLGAGLRAEFLRGVVLVDERLVAIIDLGHALSATEKEAIEGLKRELSTLTATVEPTSTLVTQSESDSHWQDEEYLVFSVSGETMALPLQQLRGVAQRRPPTPVPGAASWILGAINMRGEVIPLLDLAQPLHLPSAHHSPRSYSLIVDIALRSGYVPAALAVDDVIEVVSSASERVTGKAAMGLRLPAEYVRAIVRAADAYVPVLDAATLFAGIKPTV